MSLAYYSDTYDTHYHASPVLTNFLGVFASRPSCVYAILKYAGVFLVSVCIKWFHPFFQWLTNRTPFSTECYAIIEALTLISSLRPNTFLIASGLMSYLQCFTSKPFNSHL